MTKGGVSCEGGGERPCFQPLYKEPQEHRPLSINDIVNAYTTVPSHPNEALVTWPYEKYGSNPGDPVDVVCQVKGETIQDAYGDATDVWDVVQVPVELPHATEPLINATALAQAKSAHPPFGVEKSQGQPVAVYAYASALWLGDRTSLGLPTCTAAENPGRYAPVQQ